MCTTCKLTALVLLGDSDIAIGMNDLFNRAYALYDSLHIHHGTYIYAITPIGVGHGT